MSSTPPAPAPGARREGPSARARSAVDWSDEQRGLVGLSGDLAWARSRSRLDCAVMVAVFLLLVSLSTLVLGGLDLPPWAPLLAPLGSLGLAQLHGWLQARRRTAELSDRARRRDRTIRAAASLVDDPAVRRPGRDLLALEGWREGLPVELSAPIRIVPDEAQGDGRDDDLVVRVGAPAASRRPRAVTHPAPRVPWLAPPATTVPEGLRAWREQRSLAALRASELVRRFGLRSLSWGPDGVELRGPADHRLFRFDRLDALLAGAVALAQACGLVAVTRVRVVVEQAGQGTCPYCRDELASAERAACVACGTEHHLLCFTEHGRCTVWGCGRPWASARPRDRAQQ